MPADETVAEIARLLKPWGARLDEWQIRTRRTSGETNTRMRHWNERGRTASTLLAWIGHGATYLHSRAPELFVSGDQGSGVDGLPVQPGPLANYVRDHLRDRGRDGLWTILLVEACGGRQFIESVEGRAEGHRQP